MVWMENGLRKRKIRVDGGEKGCQTREWLLSTHALRTAMWWRGGRTRSPGWAARAPHLQRGKRARKRPPTPGRAGSAGPRKGMETKNRWPAPSVPPNRGAHAPEGAVDNADLEHRGSRRDGHRAQAGAGQLCGGPLPPAPRARSENTRGIRTAPARGPVFAPCPPSLPPIRLLSRTRAGRQVDGGPAGVGGTPVGGLEGASRHAAPPHSQNAPAAGGKSERVWKGAPTPPSPITSSNSTTHSAPRPHTHTTLDALPPPHTKNNNAGLPVRHLWGQLRPAGRGSRPPRAQAWLRGRQNRGRRAQPRRLQGAPGVPPRLRGGRGERRMGGSGGERVG